VLAIELPWLDNVEQAKTPKRLPVVLNRDENNWGQSKIKCLTQRLTGARPFGTLFIFKLA
jgi:hypothetical protein